MSLIFFIYWLNWSDIIARQPNWLNRLASQTMSIGLWYWTLYDAKKKFQFQLPISIDTAMMQAQNNIFFVTIVPKINNSSQNSTNCNRNKIFIHLFYTKKNKIVKLQNPVAGNARNAFLSNKERLCGPIITEKATELSQKWNIICKLKLRQKINEINTNSPYVVKNCVNRMFVQFEKKIKTRKKSFQDVFVQNESSQNLLQTECVGRDKSYKVISKKMFLVKERWKIDWKQTIVLIQEKKGILRNEFTGVIVSAWSENNMH